MLPVKMLRDWLDSVCRYLRWPVCLLLVSNIGLAGMAKACGDLSGPQRGAQFDYTAQMPVSMTVPRNYPVGWTVADTQWQTSPSMMGYTIGCYGSESFVYSYSTAQAPYSWVLSPGFSDVYQTGVQGIGIRMYASPSMDGSGAVALGAPPGAWRPIGGSADPHEVGPMPSLRVQLVVTGPVGYGTTNLPTNVVIGLMTAGGLTVGGIRINTNTTFLPHSCSVSGNRNHAVGMPTVSSLNLPTVGATWGNGSFTLSLSCDAGVTIQTTFTDVSDPANRSNNLSLTSASTAKGVGYRLTAGNGKPVYFGADSNAAGNPGEVWLGYNQYAGSFNMPFSVQYVRTGAIVGGTANAAATYTMSYQ